MLTLVGRGSARRRSRPRALRRRPRGRPAGRAVLERLDDALGLRVDTRDRPVLGVQDPDRALADGDVARRRLRPVNEPTRSPSDVPIAATPLPAGGSAAAPPVSKHGGRGRDRSPGRRRGSPGDAHGHRRRAGARPSRASPSAAAAVVDQLGAGRVALVALLREASREHRIELRVLAQRRRKSSCMCAHSVSASVSRRNGGTPVRHS